MVQHDIKLAEREKKLLLKNKIYCPPTWETLNLNFCLKPIE